MIEGIYHSNYRFICLTLMLFAFFGQETQAYAEDSPVTESKIVGVPYVESADEITLNGKRLKLWGIFGLAPDQQCYQGSYAWKCGKQAITALEHYMEGKTIECQIIEEDQNLPRAQCFCPRHHGKKDISRHMLSKGWAILDKKEAPDTYKEAEARARKEQRGIWCSKFQSPQNWEKGVQKYMNEQ